MKRIAGRIILGALFFILAISLVFRQDFQQSSYIEEETKVDKTDVLAAENATNAVPEISHGYVVREYKGSIAVFEVGKDKPFKMTNTMVGDLPQVDREILKNGISVATSEELNVLLEDYCS